MKTPRTALLSVVLESIVVGSILAAPVFSQSKADQAEFERRYARVDKSSVDDLLELADWATSKKLTLLARRCYRKILRIDPQNTDANLAMGNVEVGDKWVPKRKAEAARKALAAAKKAEARGAMEVETSNGEKIDIELPSEDTDRATITGLLRANRSKATQLARAWVDSAGVDDEQFHVAMSPHCVILAKESLEDCDTLAQIGEYVYRRLNWITWGKTDVNPFRDGGGRHLYWLVDKDEYSDLINFLVEQRHIDKRTGTEIMKRSAEVGGYSLAFMKPMHLTKTPENRSSTIANGMAHHWMAWNSRAAAAEVNIKTGQPEGIGSGGRGRGNLLNWLTESIGIWASLDAIRLNNFFRFTRAQYANVGRAKKGADNDYVAMCYELATGQYGRGTGVKSFYQLTRSKLNKLSDLDLAMGWSIVDYLLRERTSQWRKLVTLARSKTNSFRIAWVATFGTGEEKAQLKKLIETKNDRSLEDLYRRVADRFEQQWKAWAKREYKSEYDDPASAKQRDAPFTPIERGRATQGGDDDAKKPKKKKKKKRRRRRR